MEKYPAPELKEFGEWRVIVSESLTYCSVKPRVETLPDQDREPVKIEPDRGEHVVVAIFDFQELLGSFATRHENIMRLQEASRITLNQNQYVAVMNLCDSPAAFNFIAGAGKTTVLAFVSKLILMNQPTALESSLRGFS